MISLPSRSSPERRDKVKNFRLRRGFGATVFALALPRERRLEPRGLSKAFALAPAFELRL